MQQYLKIKTIFNKTHLFEIYNLVYKSEQSIMSSWIILFTVLCAGIEGVGRKSNGILTEFGKLLPATSFRVTTFVQNVPLFSDANTIFW
jgi:hypothetical protein